MAKAFALYCRQGSNGGEKLVCFLPRDVDATYAVEELNKYETLRPNKASVKTSDFLDDFYIWRCTHPVYNLAPSFMPDLVSHEFYTQQVDMADMFKKLTAIASHSKYLEY